MNLPLNPRVGIGQIDGEIVQTLVEGDRDRLEGAVESGRNVAGDVIEEKEGNGEGKGELCGVVGGGAKRGVRKTDEREE